MDTLSYPALVQKVKPVLRVTSISKQACIHFPKKGNTLNMYLYRQSRAANLKHLALS